MTKERVLDALKIYIQLLEEEGATPTRWTESDCGQWRTQNHLLWMCTETAVLINEDRIEKAMRWLGFIQGAFWAHGTRTLEDLKRDNMPTEATFDEKRV